MLQGSKFIAPPTTADDAESIFKEAARDFKDMNYASANEKMRRSASTFLKLAAMINSFADDISAENACDRRDRSSVNTKTKFTASRDTTEEARALFMEAKEALQSKDYASAVDKMRASASIFNNVADNIISFADDIQAVNLAAAPLTPSSTTSAKAPGAPKGPR